MFQYIHVYSEYLNIIPVYIMQCRFEVVQKSNLIVIVWKLKSIIEYYLFTYWFI